MRAALVPADDALTAALGDASPGEAGSDSGGVPH
jgi:hypothetical protein